MHSKLMFSCHSHPIGHVPEAIDFIGDLGVRQPENPLAASHRIASRQKAHVFHIFRSAAMGWLCLVASIHDSIAQLRFFHFAFAPFEWLGLRIVSGDDRLNGLP